MQSTASTVTGVRHACALPVSDEQLWEMSARFIADGLSRGERVVYFEDESADQVLGRLADDGVPVQPALDEGRLLVAPTAATREALSGSVARLEASLLDTIDESLRHGYPRVRLTGQAAHAVRRVGGVGLPEYEAGVCRVIDRRPAASVLCFYDQQRFPAGLIRELRSRHDHEIRAPAVYDDGLLRITRTGPGCVRMAGEADHSNRGIVDRLLDTVLDEVLRSSSGPDAVTVDLASLRFLDVAGAAALVAAADRFPITHRLVIRAARPRVHRVLERCGALFTPQLDLPVRAVTLRRATGGVAEHRPVPVQRS
ncbi:MAG: MEDS domain-containing protein [Pseudonocardia sp.]